MNLMKLIIKRFKEIVRESLVKFKVYKIYLTDASYYLKYSITLRAKNKDQLAAKILLLMHSIEKGMSFKVKKKGYGKEKSITLLAYIDKYIDLFGKDELVTVALNILNKYTQDELACKEEMFAYKLKGLIEKIGIIPDDNIGGVLSVDRPRLSVSYDDLYNLFESRRSIRYYSQTRNITEEELSKAIAFASLTPTACNRQASRIYSFRDKMKIERILDNQLGDQGWCKNADTLFIITSNQSYFGEIYERTQAYVDAGLFSMNFMMGLHVQNIATCFKMYVRDGVKDKAIRKIANIPENEIPIVLILAGHYPDNKVNIPQSFRFTKV